MQPKKYPCKHMTRQHAWLSSYDLNAVLQTVPHFHNNVTTLAWQVAVELGTYIGYSAICQARNLPPGGKLYGVDPNAAHVRIAREIVQHAGLSDKIEIIEGVLETSIPVCTIQHPAYAPDIT